MEKGSVCAPRLAETDTENNTVITPNVSSVTEADKVINIKISSAQIEGDQGEQELLKGLLTNDYCHVCDAVLLLESQRLCHYEGKKHAQRLQLYLQTQRAEKMTVETSSIQRTMPMDMDRFCELCNMVFSSPVVARSHYEGKVHAKHLRKHGLPPTDVLVVRAGADRPSPSGLASTTEGHKPASDGGMEPQHPAATSNTSMKVPMDPDKYCALCPASFNNPQMALQHYNGRKHQRNQARQELLKELGGETQNANSLTCHMCSIKFNSVEMYQAHMQGNKHQIKEKKVLDLCKSQQKTYNSYTDELADYIQVQKARGVATKIGHTHSHGAGEEQVHEAGERAEEARVNPWDGVQRGAPAPHPPPGPIAATPAQTYYPASVDWCPPYRSHPAHGWAYPPAPYPLPGTGPTLPPHRPVARRRRREEWSSSSSYTSSSCSSSSSSSTGSSSSDSDDRRRRRRRAKRGRKARGAEEGSGEEQRGRRKRPKVIRDGEPEERRRREDASRSEERRRRRRQRYPDSRRRREKAVDCWREQGEEGGERQAEEVNAGEPSGTTGERQGEAQAAVVGQQGAGEQAKSPKAKHRKEKKKTKAKEQDSRTEEEKLWDESILGM